MTRAPCIPRVGFDGMRRIGHPFTTERRFDIVDEFDRVGAR